jgi:hypothetical protein
MHPTCSHHACTCTPLPPRIRTPLPPLARCCPHTPAPRPQLHSHSPAAATDRLHIVQVPRHNLPTPHTCRVHAQRIHGVRFWCLGSGTGAAEACMQARCHHHPALTLPLQNQPSHACTAKLHPTARICMPRACTVPGTHAVSGSSGVKYQRRGRGPTQGSEAMGWYMLDGLGEQKIIKKEKRDSCMRG